MEGLVICHAFRCVIWNWSGGATHRLSRAPPTSHSQPLQPFRSWLRAQCSGWKQNREGGVKDRHDASLSVLSHSEDLLCPATWLTLVRWISLGRFLNFCLFYVGTAEQEILFVRWVLINKNGTPDTLHCPVVSRDVPCYLKKKLFPASQEWIQNICSTVKRPSVSFFVQLLMWKWRPVVKTSH